MKWPRSFLLLFTLALSTLAFCQPAAPKHVRVRIVEAGGLKVVDPRRLQNGFRLAVNDPSYKVVRFEVSYICDDIMAWKVSGDRVSSSEAWLADLLRMHEFWAEEIILQKGSRLFKARHVICLVRGGRICG
ncbi:hypothetical protein [Flaviaesturariibacter amylovorans]|uniref:Uncharacterized protein n=1 Tax=Flaviaesturariibacter amylovorans TaxID=1084520 RepID=A0ABP8GA98_9BACT